MFTDKIELKDFDKMDPEYKELLGHVLKIQADCEIGGPHLYVETMLPAAPTKLDQLIVARTAAEEIDHYRKVARVADSSRPGRTMRSSVFSSTGSGVISWKSSTTAVICRYSGFFRIS